MLIRRANLRLLALLGVSSAVHAGALLAYGYLYPAVTRPPAATTVLNVALTRPEPIVATAPLPVQPQQLVTHSKRAERVVTQTARAIDAAGQARQRVEVESEAMAEVVLDSAPQLASTQTALGALTMPEPLQPVAALQAYPVVEKRGAIAAQKHGESVPTAKVEPQQSSRQLLEQRLGEQLLRAFEDYFSYPLKARRKGLQGELVLAVTVGASGLIESISLSSSSGHKALDRAALHSMAQVETVDLSWLEAGTPHAFNLQVPVSYRLVN